MPTLQDYPGVSRTGDQNSRIKGSLDQLPTKNYNLVSICSKISKSSGFLCLYYGFWLHFLAWCTLFVANKKRRKISCLKSLIERSTFFPRNWLVGGRGGGGDRESESEKIFWGGSHWQIRLGGGEGRVLVRKKSLKIWDLHRKASLNMGIINWTDNVN